MAAASQQSRAKRKPASSSASKPGRKARGAAAHPFPAVKGPGRGAAESLSAAARESLPDAQLEGRRVLAIESNDRTRAMYRRNGVEAVRREVFLARLEAERRAAPASGQIPLL